MSLLRRIGLPVCLSMLAACSGDAAVLEPTDGVTAGGEPTGPIRQIIVHEGTNLSFAADKAADIVVLSLQGALFRTSFAGGDATRLPTPDMPDMDAREPSLNADGSRVVFQGYAAGNWDLYEMRLPDGTAQRLTADAWDDREPMYGPRNDIAFSSDRAGGYNVWIREQATGRLRQITHDIANAHSPAWSADGGSLAYAVDGAAAELKVIEMASGIVRSVIAEPGVMSGIAWSPDGEEISYQLQWKQPDGVLATSLRSVNLTSGRVQDLSQPGADVFPFRATWLDSQQVLFAVDGGITLLTLPGGPLPSGTPGRLPFNAVFSLDRPEYTIRRRDHDAQALQQALGIVSPAVANSGEVVAFTALGNLWSWRPSSGELVQLTDDEAAEQTPVFLPDGLSLLYVTDRDGSQSLVKRSLLSEVEEIIPVPGAKTLSFPAVSRDGRQLAVFRDVDSGPLAGQLVIVDLSTGAVREVGQPMPPQRISWSKDDRVLLSTRLRPYSNRFREGVYELVFINAHDGSVRSIVPVPHRSVVDAALSADGQAVTYVQDGLLWRLDLDARGEPVGSPAALTHDLTDQPAFSTNGRFLVFSSGKQLQLRDMVSGTVATITPPVRYAQALPAERWVLRAGRVFDGRLASYREQVDLVISGHRIEAIEPIRITRSERVVDASHLVVVPGLFEMHAHMGSTTAEQGRVWLAWGITSVRDPGAQPYVAKERQEAWDSGVRPGPRTHVTGYLTDGNRVFYAMAESISDDAHLDRALRRATELEYDFIKTYVRLPDHWQQRVIDHAHGTLGIPVSSHELYPAAANGADHVEHLGGTSRRGYAPKVSALGRSYADVVELLVASGMGITPTMVLPGFAVIAQDDDDLFATPQFRRFYGKQVANRFRARLGPNVNGARAILEANGSLLRRLVARDALVVTGTDAPFVPYGAGLHAEFRLYARSGLTPAQILNAATWKSAVAAHVEHDLGSIEVGKVADLVVIDGDPLADIRDLDNVVMTVKGGHAYTQAQLGVATSD